VSAQRNGSTPGDPSGANQEHGARLPYSGMRVVELAFDPAGELAGRLLAEMGAEVVKVEPPGGVPSRHTGPFVDDVADPDASLAYWFYNAGKRSVVLDVDQPGGRAGLDELLADADVLLSTLPPRRLAALGLDLDGLVADRPSLIVVSVTPFGLDGPWADHAASDLVLLATSGLLITSGYDDHTIPPIRPGGDQAFHTAASFAHLATTLALLERRRTGRGGVVDVSVHDACVVTVELANPYWFYPRVLVHRQTCRHAQPTPTQPALFECADGRYVYFALILADQKPWQSLVTWMDGMGIAADLVDEAYLDVAYRQAHFQHIQGLVEVFFLLQDAERAYHEGQERGLPIGILNAPEDLYTDEHLHARGFFATVADVDPPHPFPSAPYRFSAFTPAGRRRAPRLGEHQAEVVPVVATDA
jgi:crotonobetainyl-CoA:carnitine CoA-transferase CaiB-like acyl-CoA transferase